MIAPTPYPEVNQVLDLLLSGVSPVLGESLVGMYLYGSLCTGDFNLQTSDIDFLVVMDSAPSTDTTLRLEEVHRRLSNLHHKWIDKLEGGFISRSLLRRHDPSAPPCPFINEGQFFTAPLGSDWVIQRFMLRENGIVVSGPPLLDLIDPVSLGEVQQAIRNVLTTWWLPLTVPEDQRLKRDDYQAFGILSMCRALLALEQGQLCSKTAAAAWALQTLDSEWFDLIRQALAWQPEIPMAKNEETRAFIRMALTRVGIPD